jgi:phosphoribosylformylglycinamidine synthase
VVSGNVSFYNESPEGPFHPTPIIGMLGTLPDVNRHGTLAFRAEGDLIYRVGPDTVTLGGSEYLAVIHAQEAGRPAPVDLDLEGRVQSIVRDLIREGLLQSAHDCAEGGLAVALAECCIAGHIGARITAVGSRQYAVGSDGVMRPADERDGAAEPVPGSTELPAAYCLLPTVLFGEGPSRILVSVRPEARTAVEARLSASGVLWQFLGTVGGEALLIDDLVDVAVSALEETWEQALPNIMNA